MVYSYKPETIQTPFGLKLIEPTTIPQDEAVSNEHKTIQSKAAEQAPKKILNMSSQLRPVTKRATKYGPLTWTPQNFKQVR